MLAPQAKPKKVKKLKRDQVYNPDIHNNETEEEHQDRLQRKQRGEYFLNDFKIL